MYIDYSYLVLVLPALVFVLIAQAAVKRTFAKYSNVPCARGITGAEAAMGVLRQNGVYQVQINPVPGNLTDHFDPRTNVISLSQGTYGAASVAAVSVAAHEAGHACQYAEGSTLLTLRAKLVPVVNIGSNLAFPLIVLGALTSISIFYTLGILLFGLSVLFHLLTLPVEIDASRRAMKALESGGYLQDEETAAAKKVLRAAAMTYVASLALSAAQFLRLILLYGGGRRRR